MNTPIDGYSDSFGNLTVPTDPAERIAMARKLFGWSLVNSLDHWLDFAVDKIENSQPEKHVTTPTEELHDELSEWFYIFSKYKDQLVIREKTSLGDQYRLK